MISSEKSWRNGKVLVVGDVMLDRYWVGPSRRISPEAPVPVVKISAASDRLGGAANVAANVAAMGATVNLIGLIGDDEPGREVARQCDANGIGAHLLVDSKRETTLKLRVMSQQQQLIRLDFEADNPPSNGDALTAKYRECLAAADVVILSDYGKGTLNNSGELIRLAKEAGTPVIVDPKSTDFSRYQGAFLVTPNYAEFERCVGACASDDEICEKAAALCRVHSIEQLLVTRGERGMLLIRADEKTLSLATNAREVFDVTGAGDTVCAVIGAALAGGEQIDAAVSYANTAAGIAVAKSGTAAVSFAELQAVVVDRVAGDNVVTLAELMTALGPARQRGERIVMTNGCFDILHAGHVGYLAQARALGARLVVALNSDESVRRLKGQDRPINSLENRMAVIAALGAVDWVVSFDQDNPLSLVEAIKPDVLVKGGDYAVADIIGGELVRANGGDVVVLPFVQGLSTSNIVNRLHENEAAD